MINPIFLSSILFEEHSQTEILLTPHQAEGMTQALASIGIDASNILHYYQDKEGDGVEPPIGEATIFNEEEMPASAPHDLKLPKKNAPLKIPLEIAPGTIEAAKRFFELGKEAGNWYFDAANTLREAFGGDEQGLVLFTTILAATSVQNEVYTNFLEAVSLYQAIQSDIATKPAMLRKFVLMVGDGEISIEQARTYFSSLNIFKNIKVMKMMSVPAKLMNIINVLKLWTETGSLTKDQARQAIVNSLVDRKINKKQLMQMQPEDWFTPNNPFIGKMKIGNYALTLLDPEYSHSKDNPFNVVVDTWMFRVFFPDFLKQGMDQKESGRILNKLFSSRDHYNAVAGMVSELAAEAGVSPHVMQAAIWTGIKYQWEGPSAAETNYVATINNLITKYGDAIEGMKEEANKLAEIIRTLTPTVAAQAVQDRRVSNIQNVVKRTTARRQAAKAAAGQTQ